MEILELAKLVREPSGVIHKPRTSVVVVGVWREIGTHRSLLRVVYSDTHTKGILLPEDVREISCK